MNAAITASIPGASTTARGLYADGFRAAVAAMHVLAEHDVNLDGFRAIARDAVIPAGSTGRTDYDHGRSDAWASWLSKDRQARRYAAAVNFGARFGREARA